MILASPESLVITSKPYGAFEVQKLIKFFTLRGFTMYSDLSWSW